MVAQKNGYKSHSCQSARGNGTKVDKALPNVAPIKQQGNLTTLKPAPRVNPVNKILSKSHNIH
jgi:hypothetical protein